MACAVAGITADANMLVQSARVAAQRYLFSYQEDIPAEQLVQRLCDQKQGYTQFGGKHRAEEVEQRVPERSGGHECMRPTKASPCPKDMTFVERRCAGYRYALLLASSRACGSLRRGADYSFDRKVDYGSKGVPSSKSGTCEVRRDDFQILRAKREILLTSSSRSLFARETCVVDPFHPN
jgi:hypothetical protein